MKVLIKEPNLDAYLANIEYNTHTNYDTTNIRKVLDCSIHERVNLGGLNIVMLLDESAKLNGKKPNMLMSLGWGTDVIVGVVIFCKEVYCPKNGLDYTSLDAVDISILQGFVKAHSINEEWQKKIAAEVLKEQLLAPVTEQSV